MGRVIGAIISHPPSYLRIHGLVPKRTFLFAPNVWHKSVPVSIRDDSITVYEGATLELWLAFDGQSVSAFDSHWYVRSHNMIFVIVFISRQTFTVTK